MFFFQYVEFVRGICFKHEVYHSVHPAKSREKEKPSKSSLAEKIFGFENGYEFFIRNSLNLISFTDPMFEPLVSAACRLEAKNFLEPNPENTQTAPLSWESKGTPPMPPPRK